MTMKFDKMHGIGNDYVYVDAFREEIADRAKAAVVLSDRHFGIGSDGLILICPSERADFRMEMYNADGSRGKMCGNGIRCVGKYVYDHGMTDKTELRIETDAGDRYLKLFVEGGKVSAVRVDMGSPVLEPSAVPVSGDFAAGRERLIDVPLQVDGREYAVSCVSMGNPHCVIFMDQDIGELNLEQTGPSFETHPAFPEQVNTEFINRVDEHTISMRVWERGSGETMACGTGACAAAAAAILSGRCESPVKVQLLGGDLEIEWNGRDSVYMTGTATTVFTGEVNMEEMGLL